MTAYVSIEGVARRYGPTTVFQDVWFGIARGEFVCLVGHSGCGKTTILNILAGLEAPDDGAVIVDGQAITGPSLDRAVVFQGHALMPWMTAAGNVAFAISCRHRDWSRAACDTAAREALKRVGLDHAADRKPAELSGGMKQRVGIARALSIEPKVLLLDEPFGALDALTRAHLQDELLKIVAKTHSTVLMVTHDVDEAVLLSDRIVMMTNGPAATIGDIVEVDLARPRDRLALVSDSHYHKLRGRVLEFLYQKQLRPAA